MTGRYYCGNAVLQPGAQAVLSEEESRHLLKVMRARPGDEVVVFGDCGQFAATLTGTDDRTRATVQIGEPVAGPQPPSVRMTFLVPWIKGGKTELLIQKLTELGAMRVVVFQARRDVVRGDGSKLERLQRIGLESCKQCERVEVPNIVLAESLADAFSKCKEVPVACRLVLHERKGENLFGQIVGQALTQSRELVVASGPEGGWHFGELAEVQGESINVSLGPRILRAETAPIAAAAAILAIAGDL